MNEKNKKSCVFDLISHDIIKMCKDIFATILTKLINLSIDERSCSYCLKVAKKIPKYNKGNKINHFSNNHWNSIHQ